MKTDYDIAVEVAAQEVKQFLRLQHIRPISEPALLEARFTVHTRVFERELQLNPRAVLRRVRKQLCAEVEALDMLYAKVAHIISLAAAKEVEAGTTVGISGSIKMTDNQAQVAALEGNDNGKNK